MRLRPYAWLPWPLRWLARALTVLLALALVLTGVVVHTVRTSFPQVDGSLRLPGLTGNVEIYRDKYGIPQIYADTSEDLFMAQGFVHAQDRFWEMDFRRHVTAGRLSELFGEATLDSDKAIRTMGWRRVAEQELSELSERTRRYLDAYAKGVNTWLKANPNASDRSLEYSVLKLTGVDAKPEPWTALDSVAWLKAMAWDLRSNMEDEIDRALALTRLPRERVEQLYPGYPFDEHAPIVTRGAIRQDQFDQTASPRRGQGTRPRGPAAAALAQAARTLEAVPGTMSGADRDGIGSNSWVVSGEHTRSGKPLLANDPHLSAAMPSVWYQAGLHCRELSERCSYDVTGFTFSGVPGVVIGHTDKIAWGFTNLGPDVADLFLEQVSGDTYLYRGERVKLEKRQEKIKVAGGDTVTIEVRSTRHGPLINDVMGDVKPSGGANAVALQWTALMPGRTADAIFALNEAGDWHEFRAAAALFEVPAQNLVYADTAGNIGYQAPGRIPVREKGDGTWPVPGWTGEYDWKTAPIPYDRLPSVENPPEGWIVTANNAVIDPRRYQPLLTKDWSYGYRSQRITDRLEQAIAKGDVDASTMAAIQRDTRNGLADTLVPALMDVRMAGPAVQARDLLKGWDGSQGADSAPAAYFNAVWRHLLSDAFDDDLPEGARPSGGDRWYVVVRRLLDSPDDPFWDDTTTKGFRETRDDILRQAMADAYQEVSEALGSDVRAWRWGDLHRLTLTNASLGTSGIAPVEALFNRGPLSVAGGKDAVDATGWNVAKGYEVTSVPSMRMVVDLADLDKSQWINLTGASGHAFHANYWDQAETWARGELTPMLSKPQSVRQAAAHTLRLRP
ncbi:penicillin acylase family protein [Nonomuraea roseoviolacea]|uniref:Penicillin amidase n=1 Tax=Nonomuraea roseoviolacea subsp. carminata TaxID=160689 RepID=A0ABT1K4Y1_9ACTN|nr:penicillin acylase family protein [Nonomuraea roseoviolacea]MCP2348486.1 penicillin amidase [Nonomuraea roseoviolacea subsp. carminata]